MSNPERRPKADTFHAEQLPYSAKQSDMDPQPDSDLSNCARRPSCSSSPSVGAPKRTTLAATAARHSAAWRTSWRAPNTGVAAGDQCNLTFDAGPSL